MDSHTDDAPAENEGPATRRQRLRNLLTKLRPLTMMVLAALVGVVLYRLIFPPPAPLTQEQVNGSIAEAMASATVPPAFSAEIYQYILPSVVFIQTDDGDDSTSGVGIGSGVVVNQNGEILTSLHVVQGAATINVYYADGSQVTAKIRSADPENDMATLTPLQAPGLIVPATLGSPNRMRIGDEAYAVGNPLGLVASMSAGVISGFNRSIPIPQSDAPLEGLIQFDTSVNPGSSGGPLINRNGQVIGIVTALANPEDDDSFAGIGFAVPIGEALGGAGGPNY